VTRCASALALEAHLLDPGHTGIEPHLESCSICRARLSRMEREGEEFRRFVHPRTLDRVLAGHDLRRKGFRRWFAVLVPAGGMAAAAAAMLLLSPEPPSGYMGAKGTPLAMRVWVGEAEGAREVVDGGAVQVGSRLRFRVAAGSPCRLWLVSVDARGDVSRLYPAQGDVAADLLGGATLPGGVALDDVAGPERLFAVCSAEALPLEAVERASRDAAAGGAEALRRSARLEGLPAGTTQATLLVEKVP
jgi:hypothetical protein